MFGKLRVVLVLIAGAMLAACGGGGGDGGTPGKPDSLAPAGDFTLSSASLSFTAATPTSAVPSQRLTLSKLGSSVKSFTIAVPPGATQPGWLHLSFDPTAFYADISVAPQGLANGSQATTLRVSTLDAAGNTLLSKDLPVSLTVGPVVH